MTTAKPILLIEDDPMIGRSLVRALNDAGMAVDWLRDGVQGQEAIESGCYALVLLDLGLPRKSGFEVLESIRTRGNRTPLFIITARDEIDDRVSGLDLGADDYLIKPFGFKELMARIRGVLRRNGSHVITSIGNGEIMLNLATHEAIYREKKQLLSVREMALLQGLIENPGMILSRSQIEKRLYGWNDEVESNVVEVLIHSLRKKFDYEIIRNVRGIGWMVLKHSA
ncbi:MAG: response regulator transcription factor [Gallionella sp.]